MASESAHGTDVIPELPGYRIVRQLGHGNMGVVYLAEDLRLRRQVALKVLPPTLVDSELFRARFDRESHHAATLDHPNIIPVYAAGEAAGAQYIAMRYVAGGDLRTLLKTTGPLSLGQARAVIVAVADALDAAHAQGIIHRDVKPANILIDNRNGQHHYYLSDFGIAKIASTGGSLTSTGQILGTIDYLAPEQVQGKPIDSRADLYALGCVLYYCLTGAVPFSRADIAALMWAHVHEEPPPVTSRRPDLPPQIDRIVAKALAKQPADRYPTGRELAAALHALTVEPATCGNNGKVPAEIPIDSTRSVVPAGMTGTYTALAPPSARTPATTTSPRRKWWWIAACSVLAPVLIAGSTIVVRNYLNSRYPTKAEQALLDQLLYALVDSCQRSADTEQDPTNVQASVTCTPDREAYRIVFTKFASPEALYDHYNTDVATARISQKIGDCHNMEWAEREYTGESGQRNGRVLCYRKRGASFIEWTDNNSQTLSLAMRRDSDYDKLRNWWADLVNMKLPTPKLPAPEPTQAPATPLPLPATTVPRRPAPEAAAAGPAAPAEEAKKQPPVQPAEIPTTTPNNPITTPTAPTVASSPTRAPNSPNSPLTPSVTLNSPTPNEPGLRQDGRQEPGTGGCRQTYNTSMYACTITRTAPLYIARTTHPYTKVNPKTYGFLCQSKGVMYPEENLVTHWWAWVLGSNFPGAWIPVTFLIDAPSDAPEPGLPRCVSSPTTTTTPPTTTTKSQPAGH